MEVVMEKLKQKIKYLAEKSPEKLAHFITDIYNDSPDKISEMIEGLIEGQRITDHHQYKQLVNKLKWHGGSGKGEKWTIEDATRLAEKVANVDFKNAEYTEFDFAYVVNMLYALFNKIFTESTYYIKMAKCLLEYKDEDNKQYYGDFFKPIEDKKYKHHHQARYENRYRMHDDEYDEYDEESRRRRYRSESDYDNRYENARYEDNRYEDSRTYENRRYR